MANGVVDLDRRLLRHGRQGGSHGEKGLEKGEPLPADFYAVTKQTCLDAYLEGVKMYGPAWQNAKECDGNTYVFCIQEALFGEVVYG